MNTLAANQPARFRMCAADIRASYPWENDVAALPVARLGAGSTSPAATLEPSV